jgi:hypothetical protein
MIYVLIRAWTYVYTLALPADIRDRRRAEIASDIWESGCDNASQWSALIRFLRGVPADLIWRFEMAPRVQPIRVVVACIGAITIAVAIVWTYVQQPVALPLPRQVSIGGNRFARLPPPPPPPPPPPRRVPRDSGRSIVPPPTSEQPHPNSDPRVERTPSHSNRLLG